MREFEERKVEIFRRSQERIRERKKKRKRILLCCIPLFLCVTVFSLFGRQGILSFHKSANKSSAIENEMTDEEMFCPYIMAEVWDRKDGEYSQKFSDPDILMKITDILHSLYEDDQTEQEYVEAASKNDQENQTKPKNEEAAPDDVKVALEDEEEQYQIRLTTPDGTQVEYTLVGNRFLEEGSKKEWVLSKVQLTKLKKILGLWKE